MFTGKFYCPTGLEFGSEVDVANEHMGGRLNNGLVILTLALVAINLTPAAGAPDKKPAAYWDFNEGSGQVVHDRAGKNDAYLGFQKEVDRYDPVWVKVSEKNYALQFDNVKEKSFVVIGKGHGGFDLKKGGFLTVSAWVKPSGLKKEVLTRKIGSTVYPMPSYLISKHTISSPHQGWNIAISPEKVGFSIRCEDFTEGAGAAPFITNELEIPETLNAVCQKSLADGQWHHIVATVKVEDYDEFIAEAVLYLDGAEVVRRATKVLVPTWPASENLNLLIGGDHMVAGYCLEDPDWLTGFSGLVDEVKIFDCEVTPADVKEEYNFSRLNYGR